MLFSPRRFHFIYVIYSMSCAPTLAARLPGFVCWAHETSSPAEGVDGAGWTASHYLLLWHDIFFRAVLMEYPVCTFRHKEETHKDLTWTSIKLPGDKPHVTNTVATKWCMWIRKNKMLQLYKLALNSCEFEKSVIKSKLIEMNLMCNGF